VVIRARSANSIRDRGTASLKVRMYGCNLIPSVFSRIECLAYWGRPCMSGLAPRWAAKRPQNRQRGVPESTRRVYEGPLRSPARGKPAHHKSSAQHKSSFTTKAPLTTKAPSPQKPRSAQKLLHHKIPGQHKKPRSPQRVCSPERASLLTASLPGCRRASLDTSGHQLTCARHSSRASVKALQNSHIEQRNALHPSIPSPASRSLFGTWT